MNTKPTIAEWYNKPVGKALLQSEITGLANILPKMFGYYIIQIGGPNNDNDILASSHIHNRIKIGTDIICQPNELPFLHESIDVIIVFHILEFDKDKETILSEAYNALIPGGYLITFNFNPYSLWGIRYFCKTNTFPWTGNWISPTHMRKCLSKTGFSVNDYQTFYFQPPNNKAKKLLFLECIGQFFWPYCGASYMFVSQKTAANLTPITTKIHTKHFKLAKTLPKPVSRLTQCNKNQTQ